MVLLPIYFVSDVWLGSKKKLSNCRYENGLHKVLELIADDEEHNVCRTVAKGVLSSMDLLGRLVSNIGFYSNEVYSYHSILVEVFRVLNGLNIVLTRTVY